MRYKYKYVDILIMYTPLLMGGFVAQLLPDIPVRYFIIGGVAWAILWRLVIRKNFPMFSDHTDR